MLRTCTLSFLLLLSIVTFAQNLPYQWTMSSTEMEGNEVLVEFTCEIDSGWHIYSKKNAEDVGVPTSIEVNPSQYYEVSSLVKEPNPEVKYDDVFESDVYYHEGTVVFSQMIKRKTDEAFLANFSIETQACQDNGVCTRPEVTTLQLDVKAGGEQEKGVAWIFFAGLLAGFVALLTPCVFPMIPLTVTFFTKQAENRSGGVLKAFIYGFSIIVIYVGLGLGVTTLLGEEVLNKMASSAVFNLAFFVILLLFAISFLGVFEITLPGFLVNKVDEKADKGGWIGIFFMAFALALVSFSCTGPLIGTLLVEAAVNAGVKGPLLGMFGFSVALALPFTLFAVFPNWLNSLPKSGGWLNAVKVVLGLLEIALALKFLSNADLVYQAHLITREVFIVLWIIVFFVIVLYLLGKIRFAHDSKIQHISKIRKGLAITFFGFVIYLSSGLFGAPLKLLSGVLPPVFYTFATAEKEEDGKMFSHCPNDLSCYHDYDQALSAAIAEQKPLLIDFTGWTCVNCRYMEQSIWSNPEVDSLIRNEYVLVSLYVDDRRKLAPEHQYVSDRTGKQIITLGDKWADFEAGTFGAITQPLYVLLDTSEQKLVPTQSYTTSAKAYARFLTAGINEFKQRMVK